MLKSNKGRQKDLLVHNMADFLGNMMLCQSINIYIFVTSFAARLLWEALVGG